MTRPHGPTHEAALAGYHDAVETHIGATPGRLARPGTSVHPLDERDESGVASAYRIGPSTTVWCAHRHADLLDDLAGEATIELDRYDEWCAAAGGELLGGGLQLLLEGTRPHTVEPPHRSTIVTIDRDDPEQAALVRAFVSGIDADDVDAAAVDVDDIDPAAVLLTDDAGVSAAFASWLPWEVDPRFVDIGVLTGPDRRRAGWGRAAVATTIDMALAESLIPLYRCNDDNPASLGLALSLGFVEVGRLRAWKLP